jgi:hypothetical protein
MQARNECSGQHDLFVVDCVGVEAEGKVVVLAICRHCGELRSHEVLVSKINAPLRLLNEEKEK